MININEFKKMIESDELRAYRSYINMMQSCIESINDDMIEFDAMIDLIESHDDDVIIDDQFLIIHHDYSNRALAHYEENEKSSIIVCKGECEYCSYSEKCKICDK